jgi:endonuclease III
MKKPSPPKPRTSVRTGTPGPRGRSAASPRRVTERHRGRAAAVYDKLLATHPDAHCELNHTDAFQLLIATILSAQTTDVRVNMVTPELFRRYPDAAALAKASQDDVEALVKTTGFFRNKAKSIRGAAQALVERHGGEVPRTMEELLELPGVARKTANVVLGNAFKQNVGMVVDTHVARLSYRLGFSDSDDPRKIEQDLIALFPAPSPGSDWCMLAHLLIFHGRRICTARNPQGETCPLLADCPQRGVLDPEKRAAGAAAKRQKGRRQP